MRNWLDHLKNLTTGHLARYSRVCRALPILWEIALVAALTIFAAWRFRTPLWFAANMPQEAPKYSVGAWNLYKTGRYEFVINHQRHPAMGGLGYGLLIVPSFWLFGDSLGNAIYTQWALAVLTCVGLYVAVRQFFGLWAGLLAAVTLTTYHRFQDYTQMMDTSIPSAFFFVVGLLIFSWILRDSRARLIQWLAWGLCAGWAATVRGNDVIVYMVLTVMLLRQLRPARREACQWLLAAALGAAPLLVLQAWYNHQYCGAWYRDARAYWSSNPFDNVSRVFGWRCALGLPDVRVELNGRGNLVFYLELIAAHFTAWKDLARHFSPQGRVVVFFLAGITLAGIYFAWQRARVIPQARPLLWFGVTAIGVTLLFYSFCEFRAVRYVVPIAPFCAAFLGVGITDTIRWLWQGRLTATLIPVLISVLAVFARKEASGSAFTVGDLYPVATILQTVDANVESNAVIITTIYPPLVEHCVVRDTARRIAPLENKRNYRVQPRRPKDPSKIPKYITTDGYPGDLENGAVDIFEFSALEDPARIQQLLDTGVPVYIIDHTFGSAMSKQLRDLRAHFRLQGWLVFAPDGTIKKYYPRPGVCVWKLTTLGPHIDSQ